MKSRILPALVVLINDVTPLNQPPARTGSAFWVLDIDEAMSIINTFRARYGYSSAAIALHDGQTYRKVIWSTSTLDRGLWDISDQAKWEGHEKIVATLDARKRKRR
jgi:hypothetical protein